MNLQAIIQTVIMLLICLISYIMTHDHLFGSEYTYEKYRADGDFSCGC